ncbi:MAG: discoidin domain-containing protein [Spirochaetales bacterium]|nr:discoidin domain-containing protein [Spirochaetales bacterium]
MRKYSFVLMFVLLSCLGIVAQTLVDTKSLLKGDEIAPDLSIFPAGFIPGRLLPPSLSPFLLFADTGNMEFVLLDHHMEIIHKIPAGDNDLIQLLLLIGEDIKINSHMEIVGVIPNGPLVCITPEGKIKFEIDADILDEKLESAEFWLYRDCIVFNNGSPGIIDSQGRLLSGKALEQKKLEFLSESIHMKNEDVRIKLLPLIESQHGLLCGDFYLPPNPRALGQDNFYHYFHVLRTLYNIEDNGQIDLLKNSLEFLNYDIHGNSYFKKINPLFNVIGNTIYIFDKYGKFLKEIECKGFVSAVGSSYQLEFRGEDKEYLMTIYPNTWDPIKDDFVKNWLKNQSSEIQNLIPFVLPSEIKTIKSSSVLKGHNKLHAYHPVFAFDGDPKTMWIEGDRNFGQDHWIEIEFVEPIKIDRIDFQPGCFWDIYWDQNNRVRQMTLLLDNDQFTVNFKDIMKVQGISFPEAREISKARFIINSVYKSKAWNDTAMSGISFVCDEEPVLLNFGEYSNFLERVE